MVADEKRSPSLELGCYTSILLDVRRSPCRGYIGKMQSKDMCSLMSFYYMGQKFILKLNFCDQFSIKSTQKCINTYLFNRFYFSLSIVSIEI